LPAVWPTSLVPTLAIVAVAGLLSLVFVDRLLARSRS
jgi:hypothetical protein